MEWRMILWQAWGGLECVTRCAGSVGEDAFQRWFRAAGWVGEEDGVATITVPGEIHQVWIETNYLPELTVAVNRVFDEVREVNVVVAETDDGVPIAVMHGHPEHGPAHSRPSKAAALEGEALERRIKSAGLNPAHTFASFVVGSNSQFAHAACEAVAKKTGIGYNPLVHLRRPRPGQDPPDAGHRPGNPPPPAGIARGLSDLREIHQRVHRLGAPRRPGEIPPPLPQFGRAVDRRRPVSRRQGALAGGIFPHLQHPARRPEPGGSDL